MFDLKRNLNFPTDENEAKTYLKKSSLFELISDFQSESSLNIPPCYVDLARLHALVRATKATSTWEFGVGYSTLVFADAVSKNTSESEKFNEPPKQATHTSIEAEESWMNHTIENFPPHLKDYVVFFHSGVITDSFNGRASHKYERLPTNNPQIIYVDGPDTKSVEYLDSFPFDWSNSEFVVNSSDILFLEPILIPGTIVIFDGRRSNFRFVLSNLQRDWAVETSEANDVAGLFLREDSLGQKNKSDLLNRGII